MSEDNNNSTSQLTTDMASSDSTGTSSQLPRSKRYVAPKVWKRPHSTIYGKNVEFGSKLYSDKLGELDSRKMNPELGWSPSRGSSSASISSQSASSTRLPSSPYGQSADGRKLSLGSINPHSYRPSVPQKTSTSHASDGEEFDFQDKSSPFYTDRWAGKTIRHFDSDLYSNAHLFKSLIL